MITLTNDFHCTEAAIRPRDDGTVSRRTARRVWRDLCGMTGCRCGGLAGERGGRYFLTYDWRGEDYIVVDSAGEEA